MVNYKYEVGDLLEKKFEKELFGGAPNGILVIGIAEHYIVMDTINGNIINGDAHVVEKLYRKAA